MVSPEEMATDVASSALKSSGSFFGNLLMSPFRAAGGLVKGVLGSVWNGLLATAGILGIKMMAPDLYRAALHAIGGEKLSSETAAKIKAGGTTEIVKSSAIEGFGLAAAWGGLSGMLDSSDGKASDGAGSFGTMLGTGAMIVAASVVAIGAIKEFGGPTTSAAPSAPVTPPTGKPAAAKAKS